jgi:hypothetical protein
MHVKINRGNKSKTTRKRNLQESLEEFNMQESSNNHNSIETIEIIEAINSTDPKVNDTPLQRKTTESIEITEASNSTDPKACYSPTVQINTNLGTQPKNSTNVASTPKHLVPCPFLRRKGHCLKGSKCDFSHQFGPQRPAQLYQRYNFPSFWRDPIPYPFTNFPPVISFPTFHPQTNYPGSYPQSLMGIPTKSPRFNRTQPAISFPTPHPQLNYPGLYPPQQMETHTGHPRL